jgi:hypothetical protein
MPTMKTPNKQENADSALSTAACSRWEWVERTFDSQEVSDRAFVGWIMQHVRMSPFTLKLNLRDGEVVRTTSDLKGGMKIEIRFENNEIGQSEK